MRSTCGKTSFNQKRQVKKTALKTMCSRNLPIASFWHHDCSESLVFHSITGNLRMPGSFGMLFTCCRDKVSPNSPNSQDKFQICCPDMYFFSTISSEYCSIFWVFLWIWRNFTESHKIHCFTAGWNIRSPVYTVHVGGPIMINDMYF